MNHVKYIRRLVAEKLMTTTQFIFVTRKSVDHNLLKRRAEELRLSVKGNEPSGKSYGLGDPNLVIEGYFFDGENFKIQISPRGKINVFCSPEKIGFLLLCMTQLGISPGDLNYCGLNNIILKPREEDTVFDFALAKIIGDCLARLLSGREEDMLEVLKFLERLIIALACMARQVKQLMTEGKEREARELLARVKTWFLVYGDPDYEYLSRVIWGRGPQAAEEP